MVRHCLYRIILLPLQYQELSHRSITMKNSEIRTVAISLPNFQAIRPTDYSKRVIFSCKSYEKNFGFPACRVKNNPFVGR